MMLRYFSKSVTRRVPHTQTKRAAHGVSYGPEEPVGYYVKWIAAVGGFVGLLAYDRIYSDRAISKFVTPELDVKALQEQRDQFIDNQLREQNRNIELLYPRKRTTHMTNFSANPVPQGAHRASHTNEVLDTKTIGERRSRAN